MKPIILIKLEWYKLVHQKSFWISLISFAILIWMCMYLVDVFSFWGQLSPYIRGLMQFPIVWFLIPFIAQFLSFLPALIVSAGVSNEINHRINRQHIADGMDRKDYYLSKLINITIIALACTAFISILISYFGIMNLTIDSASNEEALKSSNEFLKSFKYRYLISPASIGVYFIHLFGMLSFALLFSLVLKGNSLTSFYLFMYILLGENIISLIFSLLVKIDINPFLPIKSMYSFFDITQLIAENKHDDFLSKKIIGVKVESLSYWVSNCLGLAWILVVNFLTFRWLQKKDF